MSTHNLCVSCVGIGNVMIPCCAALSSIPYSPALERKPSCETASWLACLCITPDLRLGAGVEGGEGKTETCRKTRVEGTAGIVTEKLTKVVLMLPPASPPESQGCPTPCFLHTSTPEA